MKQILIEIYKLMGWVMGLIFVIGFILPYTTSYTSDLIVLIGAIMGFWISSYLIYEIYKSIKEIFSRLK